jgi:hypothetical protein
MSNIVKTSILVPSQLPEWIRDDPNYGAFVDFLQAYYQWMEESGNTLDVTKNIPTYMDIDSTTDQFMEYFSNDFLQYFPQDLLISKSKAIKLAKELYQAKGVPSAFKLLFKILYDSDFDVEYNKDFVFRASAGTWFSVKSVRLQTTDPRFLNINNLRLFGNISKSFAVVENSVLSGTKTEVFISDIERLFQSGETVTVVDNNNQPVLFDGEPLTATLVGQISNITIDPKNRGLLYHVGDPVVVYGGLNPNIKNPIGATAYIGSTTSGSIQNINVVNGGVGYSLYPNTLINITNGGGAQAVVASINPQANLVANVTVSIDTISPKQGVKIGSSDYHFANVVHANANTKLISALSFESFSTYPISSILVLNGGGGLSSVPPIQVESTYIGDDGAVENLYNQGILGPIVISNGGKGYLANDIIHFVGGRGIGANAKVSSVDANGTITSVAYTTLGHFKLGGMGYTRDSIPALTVVSSNTHASNASVYVSGILGDGAQVSATVTSVGSIGNIQILDPGEDYISAPYISLKIQDILVSNTLIDNLPQIGDTVYQGSSLDASSYKATVYDTHLLVPEYNTANSLYYLRTFDYNTQPNPNLPLYINGKDIELKMANTAYAANAFYTGSPEFNSSGVKIYGDGRAKASASFLNGLTISREQYLDSSGQPSSYSVLQSDVYNNFTYKLKIEKEISRYRSVLLDLLHPTGMKVLGEFSMKSNNKYDLYMTESLFTGKSLQSYTGYNISGATMKADFNHFANNIVTLTNIPNGTDISQFIFVGQPNTPNTIIEIIPVNGPNVKSEIIGLDAANNTLKLASNTWLTYGNVAFVSTSTGSNVINILHTTNAYEYINNGNYSNTSYPLKDIIYAGDTVKIGANTYTAKLVDYANNIVYTTTNILANTSNSYISVNRTLSAQTHVTLYGRVGVEYVLELLTENGLNILTEDGKTLLVD